MGWLEILGPGLLVIIGSAIGWFIKSRTDELRAVVQRLHTERRKVYSDLLDPYIRIFSDLGTGRDSEQAVTEKITSYDYRKVVFEMALLGTDDVVSAFNDLMGYVYRVDASRGEKPGPEMLLLWGNLLREIRRSLGNRRTRLTRVDMLRGMIKDIDQIEMEKPDRELNDV